MNFLTFKSFISTEVLMVFYYLGAIVLPVGLWKSIGWIARNYRIFNVIYKQAVSYAWKSLNKKQQAEFLALFVVLLVFMELFWRMFFEFLIAYMQMRDALLRLSHCSF